MYEESLAIKRRIGDKPGMGSVLHLLGLIAHERGDYNSALPFYVEGLAVVRETGNKSHESTLLNSLGGIALAQTLHLDLPA